MNIVTRFATQQDVPGLVALWEQFMGDERDAVPEADPSAVLANWTDRLLSQIVKSHVVIVETDKTPVGFAGFIDSSERDWIPQSVAYIVDIYVKPEARASSAAKLLFDHLLSSAAQKYSKIWTNTSVENRRVQILLKRAGFIPLDSFEILGLEGQLYFKKERQIA